MARSRGGRSTACATSSALSTGCRAISPPSPESTLRISGAAAGKWLLDTGPLVALLSKRDDAHEACVEVFESFRGHLLTSEAVLTEATHLLGRQRGGGAACLDFFLRAGALIVPLGTPRLTR